MILNFKQFYDLLVLSKIELPKPKEKTLPKAKTLEKLPPIRCTPYPNSRRKRTIASKALHYLPIYLIPLRGRSFRTDAVNRLILGISVCF